MQDGKMEARAIESLADRRFGAGSFRRVKHAAMWEVVTCLGDGRFLEAGFSAAHSLVLGNVPSWSDDDHQRMLVAWQAEFEKERQNGRLDKAGWRYAYLRMLGSGRSSDVGSVSEALRAALRDRLGDVAPKVSTAGVAVDLLLVNDEWVPDEAQTALLRDAVEDDVRSLLAAGTDLVMAADRVALWILIATRSMSMRWS